jgi:hypothetical protein
MVVKVDEAEARSSEEEDGAPVFIAAPASGKRPVRRRSGH